MISGIKQDYMTDDEKKKVNISDEEEIFSEELYKKALEEAEREQERKLARKY